MLELIEQSRMAVDELIDVMGRASIEAVLELSALQVAGSPQQGKARPTDIVWHGTQPGRVSLKQRKLRVNKPRLRRKGRGAGKEVPIPVLSITTLPSGGLCGHVIPDRGLAFLHQIPPVPDGRHTRYNRLRKGTQWAIAALPLRRFFGASSQPMNGSSSGHGGVAAI
jgi:hypothetical protein